MAIKATALITLTRVNDGKGIKSTSVTYQIWSNGTSTPTGTWSSTPPKTTADKPYLWTRTVITYSDNTQSTSYSVGSTPEGIVVGGRNLLRNTAFKDVKNNEEVYVNNKYTKFSNNTLKLICDNTSGTSQKYTVVDSLKSTWELADVLGQDITISMWIYIETVGQLDGYEFRILFTHNGEYQWFNPNRSYPVCIPSASELKVGWNYIYATFRVAEDSTEVKFNFTCYSRPGKKSICWISSPKAEFGNKPTAWTPAPEDQEQYVDDKIAASEKTTEESYKALINQTAQEISLLVQSVKSTADSNSSSISTIASNLKVTSDGLNATKTSINTLTDAVNGTVSKQELQQYLRWNGGDLELGNSVQPFRCKLSNTELAFYQNEDKVAWISNKELYILKAIIAQSIGCGNFLFVDEGDLGFSLI